MATATDFTFGMHFDYIEYYHKHTTRSRGYILNFRRAVHNFEMAKAIGFIFST